MNLVQREGTKDAVPHAPRLVPQQDEVVPALQHLRMEEGLVIRWVSNPKLGSPLGVA